MRILRELWTKEVTDPDIKTTYQYVVDLKDRLQSTCELAKENQQKSSQRYRTYYNKRARQRDMKEESDDEVEETRVKETTFPEIEDNESDVEVEETRVKETTFPEIEDNVDTPDTEQDSFDMGDLPPPPPPLPSLNESISNDFPPPPFIEMMGNMTVDMGTPLEEGPQADEPLPSPPRLPLESVQRVPMSDLCATCGKKGRRGLLWLCCDACQQWYHRSCAGISVQAYKTIGGNPWNCRHCH
ncbi:uncharacterized protein [Magallana gigas]|uniref:uncharacterized protein isoform X8 n=1 Tax=Magallana gigas TaxID=29159 RepID=UPI00334061A6